MMRWSASTPSSAGSTRPRVGRRFPPERLVRASLIQILFSVRSERQLMQQMQYNLLFRWFVGLGVDDPVRRKSLLLQQPASAAP